MKSGAAHGCLLAGLVVFVGFKPGMHAGQWGRLANPGFDNQLIKTTLFFSGQASDETTPYGCWQISNLHVYTLNPVPRDVHLEWTNAANRDAVLNLMVEARINVVTMSSWGEDFLPCTNNWVTGAAPMQTSSQSHDDLFATAVNKPLLIMPIIETRFGRWELKNEFPRNSNGAVAPGLVSQIVNLIQRYLQKADHPEWAPKWARVYDRAGVPRFAVVVIHASSNRLNANDHAAFAAGFDLVAAEVAARTGGTQVGFLIDALPAEGFAATFKPTASGTGPHLRNSSSFLGVQCFIPEVFTRMSNDNVLLEWKWNFTRGWFAARVPLLVDVSPGYNAQRLWPDSVKSGHSPEWLNGLTFLVNEFGYAGMVYNSWNGYAEGMAGMPVVEFGTWFFDWLRSLRPEPAISVDRNYAGFELGTPSEPFNTIAEATQVAVHGDYIQLRSGVYQEPVPSSKHLTYRAVGGPVTFSR